MPLASFGIAVPHTNWVIEPIPKFKFSNGCVAEQDAVFRPAGFAERYTPPSFAKKTVPELAADMSWLSGCTCAEAPDVHPLPP